MVLSRFTQLCTGHGRPATGRGALYSGDLGPGRTGTKTPLQPLPHIAESLAMRPLLNIVFTAVALSVAALAVQAQPTPAPAGAAATPKVDARQARQHARIADGAASGALTPHERHRLHREQKAIRHAEMHAKADGTVTPKERHRLDKMQDKASRDIYRQKHDAQVTAPKPALAP